MNITYTEELQNSMNNSNDQFIQEEYNLDHAKNAAKLSLYYAHGNTEKNEISYRTALIEQSNALSLDDKAVSGINLANNAVTAAKQSLVDSGKATSNISTAAANMQIAANAITKLSSDVAGILAVANAADHGSQIQDSVERANSKTRTAAKLAEEVSLVSLSATIEAAQSTASTVVTDSDLALSSMTDFEKATAAQYSSTSDKVVATNDSLTDARKVEKAASGSYDIALKQDKAINTTTALINDVSNHDLLVFDPALPKNEEKKSTCNNNTSEDASYVVEAGKSYTISFKRMEGDGMNALSQTEGSTSIEDGNYIQYYRMIMVKYDASKAFDINVARDLNVGTYYQFEPTSNTGYCRTFYLLGTDQALIPYDPSVEEEGDPMLMQGYNHKHVRGIAVDYLGKPIEDGEYYVAYVYAVYSDAYQKLISNTDGYLSLPSKRVQLQMDVPRIPVFKLDKDDNKTVNLEVVAPIELNSRNMAVQFEVAQKDFDPDSMEYRIMMVEESNVSAQALNKKVQLALENLDKKESHYNYEKQVLETMQSSLNEMEISFNNLQVQIEELESGLTTMAEVDYPNGKPQYISQEEDSMTTQLTTLKGQIKTNSAGQVVMQNQIIKQQEVVSEAEDAFKKALQLDETISRKKIEGDVSDFIFDTDLMSAVTPANYYVATPFKWDNKSATLDQSQAKAALNLSESHAVESMTEYATYDKQLQDAQNAVETAEDEVMTATTAFNKAEVALDVAEINYIEAKDDDSKDAAAAQLKLNAAIAALKLSNRNLELKKDILASKEIALDVVKANNNVSAASIENDLDNYVSASLAADRASEILTLSQNLTKSNKGADPGSKIVLFYTELGEDATDNYGEPLQFNDTGNWETTFDIFQDQWEKETRILGPLQKLSDTLGAAITKAMRKEKKLEGAILVGLATAFLELEIEHKIDFKLIFEVLPKEIKTLINKEEKIEIEKLEKAIVDALIQIVFDTALANMDKLLKKISKLYLLQEKHKDTIAYQAMVLTAMTSDHEDIADQYRLNHSNYSLKKDALALWGIVD